MAEKPVERITIKPTSPPKPKLAPLPRPLASVIVLDKAVTNDIVSRMRNCNISSVPCYTDHDCELACGTSNFKCHMGGGGNGGDGGGGNGGGRVGVCGRTQPQTQKPYVPCSSLYGNNVARVVDGIVQWSCESKYPGLVNNYGINVSCRQGIFVHEITNMPYVPGYHDPRECVCIQCPSGFVPTRTSCAKDSCYPGVRNWNKDAGLRAIYGKATAYDTTDWELYEKASFGVDTCLCPRGYVSCPGPAFESSETAWVCPLAVKHNAPVCVPDPCSRGINDGNVAYYNHARRRCMMSSSPLEYLMSLKHRKNTGLSDPTEWTQRGIEEYLQKREDVTYAVEMTADMPLERRGVTSLGPWVIAFSHPNLAPSRGFLTKLRGCMGYDAVVPKRSPPIPTEEWWSIWQHHMQPELLKQINANVGDSVGYAFAGTQQGKTQ